jgi:hypothetical protein
MFLDPDEPISTCASITCDDCPVCEKIHCHFKPKDLLHFLLIAIPSFLIGGLGIYTLSGWMLIPWIVIILAYFGFIEIRVMCAHCPHYAEPGNTLKCWANNGSPKIWKYRPGPMSFLEKVVFLGGFAVVWGYPLYFLLQELQLFLLVVYSISTAGFFMTLKISFCTQCMNFACPLNSVDKEIRQIFFKKNPTIAQAWDGTIDELQKE